MIHISAGAATPILVSTDDVSTTALLVRVSDGKYWSGTAWVTAPSPLPTSAFITGVRQFVTPALELGHYWVQISDILAEQLYAGGYLYNSELNTCIVYGTIRDMTGEPAQNSRIHFEPAPVTQFIDGNAITMEVRTAYTDVNGEFAIETVRTADVIVIIEEVGYRKRVTIPNQASVSVEDL